MKISLQGVGKKFEREWIFRNLDLELKLNDRVVIIGGNGSGKSTLLQILLGKSIPSKGVIRYSNNGIEINPSEIFHSTSIASPYLELIEEFSLLELLKYHFQLRKLHPNIQLEKIPSLLYLEKEQHKPISDSSSGMKQRVKLALAILTQSQLLLLDEPSSNLDKKGISWYQQLLKEFGNNRILVIASNEKEEEYPDIDRLLSIENFK